MKIGLTGGIGSGKSTISKIFSSLNIPVFNADFEAKEILNTQEITNKVTSKFGKQILDNTGFIVRSKLAEIVFNNNFALQELNSIIHPSVRAKFHAWYEQEIHYSPYVLQEAAILFESGINKLFDEIILVTTRKDIRIERVMNRDNIHKEHVLARMETQWSDEKKMKQTNYVIDNNPESNVLDQVLKIHDELMTKAKFIK